MTEARDLARLALDTSFDFGTAIERADPRALVEAISGYEGALVPLKQTDATLTERDVRKRSPMLQALDAAIKAVGAKVAPHFDKPKANAWADSVMISLSCWPAASALAGARAAIHEPFKFMGGEIDAKMHELAAAHDARQRLALARLRMMQAEIHRAANPAPAIEHQEMIWTEESIAEANACFIKAGAKTRYRMGAEGACEIVPPETYADVGIDTRESGGHMPGTEGNPESDDVQKV